MQEGAKQQQAPQFILCNSENVPPTRTIPHHPYEFDFIVIGGGSGGLAAAKEAAASGAKVACFDYVEGSRRGAIWGIGGTCVNVGCIPKKLFHTSALTREALLSGPHFGWAPPQGGPVVNWSSLVQGIQAHIEDLNFGYSSELLSKKVTFFPAFATFEDPHTIGFSLRGEKKTVTGQYILIAVGGHPTYLNIPGAEHCITSDDIFSLEQAPGKTLVVGASYVALECAGFLTSLGFETEVMVRSILLRGFDQEMADKIGQDMESHGTKFLRDAVPSRIDKLPSGKLRVAAAQGGQEIIAGEYDSVLLAIGRQPNTPKLNLQKAGVVVEPKTGKIPCVHEQTSVSHIFCVGDAQLGAPELTPTAILAGKTVARHLFAQENDVMDYRFVPTTIFTPLEYGTIGLSEEAAIEAFGPDNVEVFQTSFVPLEWALVPHLKESLCFAKLLCNRADNMRLVGFHYLGPNAGEVTNGWALGFQLGATKKDLDRVVGIHPTCAEVFNTMTATKRSGAAATKGGC